MLARVEPDMVLSGLSELKCGDPCWFAVSYPVRGTVEPSLGSCWFLDFGVPRLGACERGDAKRIVSVDAGGRLETLTIALISELPNMAPAGAGRGRERGEANRIVSFVGGGSLVVSTCISARPDMALSGLVRARERGKPNRLIMTSKSES